jgi:hypothetical protein
MIPTTHSGALFDGGSIAMNTLAVVEMVLRERATPMTVKQIVQVAGARLPSKSKTPDTVVARDLSVNIKKLGEQSLFIRTAPGLYALRELQLGPNSSDTVSVISAVLRHERAGTVAVAKKTERDELAVGGAG